jgi:hypothetical protein
MIVGGDITPLMIAAEHNRIDAVKVFLEYGANINKICNSHQKPK